MDMVTLKKLFSDKSFNEKNKKSIKFFIGFLLPPIAYILELEVCPSIVKVGKKWSLLLIYY